MVKNLIRLHIKSIAMMFLVMVAFASQTLVMAQTQTPTNEVEIVGTVSVLTAQSLSIGTQTFDIRNAEIKAGVATGKLVKIHATQNATNQWIAREVELAQPAVAQTPSPITTEEPTPIGEFEITGQITALSGSAIVVGGHSIDISGAEIKDSLALNEGVKVHVSMVDGVWIAREVEAVTIPVTGTLTLTPPGEDGQHGQDDGADHDLNDDHGNNTRSDDNNNDNHGGNNSTDDHGNHGGNNGDDNSGHGGGNGSGGHGHG